MVKCIACGAEIKNPLIIEDVNLEPKKLFIGKAFCDEDCFYEFVLKNKDNIKTKGGVINFIGSKEKE